AAWAVVPRLRNGRSGSAVQHTGQRPAKLPFEERLARCERGAPDQPTGCIVGRRSWAPFTARGIGKLGRTSLFTLGAYRRECTSFTTTVGIWGMSSRRCERPRRNVPRGDIDFGFRAC